MLVFSLDNESGKPLYQQIYEYIKEEIMQGRLSYREKLPSAREGIMLMKSLISGSIVGGKKTVRLRKKKKYRFAGNIILIRMKWTAVISLMRYFVLSPEM